MRVAILLLSVAVVGCDVAPEADLCDGCGRESAGVSTGTTIVVPVVPVTTDPPRVALYAQVKGIGSGAHVLYVPLSLAVRTVVHAVRARVQDGGSDGRLRMEVVSTTDDDQQFRPLAYSPLSSGTGAEETLTIDTPMTAAPSTQYFVELFHVAALSSAVSDVYRLELDVN